MAFDSVTDNLINVGDYRLHFRIHSGPGLAVLLESGGGANASSWDGLASVLAFETWATCLGSPRLSYLPSRS